MEPNNPSDSLPYFIRGAFRGFETALSRFLVNFDLPLSHFYILRLQWEDTGHSQKYIAEKAFMTESVASQVIQALEKNGHVTRSKHPKDSRRQIVMLTPAGLELRNKIVTQGIAVSNEHAADISIEDIQTTMKVLTEVQKAFEVYNRKIDDGLLG